MRGPRITLCLLFVGLSQAVRVYLNPPPSVPSRVSSSRANVALSRHLGLESFEHLDGQAAYSDLSSQEAFVGQGRNDALLLSVDEALVQDVLPPSMKSSFTIYSKLSLSALSSLIPTYVERAEHVYSHILSQSSSISAGTNRLLDIFSVPSAASEEFLSEATLLVDFIEGEETDSDRFAALELAGLTQLAEEYGRTSEQYKLAAQTVRAVLMSALAKPALRLALVSVPASVFSSSSSAPKSQDRDEALHGLLVRPSAKQLADSTCFGSQDVCGNATAGCSEHGECVQANKAGQSCWVCACLPTQDTKGRTQEWAGEACEKKDVSGPFVLIAGTVVALILLIGGSVALLSGVGSQELPSTLSGSIAGGSSKRD